MEQPEDEQLIYFKNLYVVSCSQQYTNLNIYFVWTQLAMKGTKPASLVAIAYKGQDIFFVLEELTQMVRSLLSRVDILWARQHAK